MIKTFNKCFLVAFVLVMLAVFSSCDAKDEKTPETETEAQGYIDTSVIPDEKLQAQSEAETEPVNPNAPELFGVKNKYGYVGDKFAYMAGVFALAKNGGKAEVYVDYSLVDNTTPGVYTVEYIAMDRDDNYTIKYATVTIYESDTTRLDIDCIMQYPELPNGCEVVSLAMALGHVGMSVDPTYLYDNFMPKDENFKMDFFNTYVGDAKDIGCGCFAPCVVKTANAYLRDMGSYKRAYDVSGEPLSELEKYIERKTPVILWGTLSMQGKFEACAWSYINGEKVEWNLYSHCMLMIGFTDDTYIFCDPLRGVVEYDKLDVERSYRLARKMACVVY